MIGGTRRDRSLLRRGKLSLSAVLVLGLAAGACSGEPPVQEPDLSSTIPDQSAPTVSALPEVPAIPAVGSLATDADPNTYFIDPASGNDGNDGQTSAQPWLTLQAALDRLQPGNTLYLMNGSYRSELLPEHSHFVMTTSGTEEAWIRVTAAPGQRPVITPTAGNGLEIRGNYVEVSNLQVVGEGFGPDNAYGWGLMTRGTHHVRFASNEVANMPVGGVSGIEATNLEIVDNIVHDNSFWGTEQGSGISVWHSRDGGTAAAADGYHDRIIGNTIYRNENKVPSRFRDNGAITDGNGIIVDQSKETGYTGRTLVANNVVFDNGGRAVLVLQSSRVDIMFNTTFRNGRTDGLEGGPAELVAGEADDVRFLNNLAWSRTGAPAIVVRRSESIVSGGNVLVTDSPGGQATEADLVTSSDPGLVAPGVDPAEADFRPLPSSVVASRALTVSPILPSDADRNPRPADGATVGAYELIAP